MPKPLFTDDPALEARLVARWQEWTRPPVLPPGLVSPAPGITLQSYQLPIGEYEWRTYKLEEAQRKLEAMESERERALARGYASASPESILPPAPAVNGQQGKKRRARPRDSSTKDGWTIEEYAARMGVCEKTVYNWRNRGKLDCFKEGHTVRIYGKREQTHG